MTGYELYVFFTCLVMFIATVMLFAAMLFIIVRQELAFIALGQRDNKIKKEYLKNINKRSFFKSVYGIVTLLVTVFLVVVFVWTFNVMYANDRVEGSIAQPRVVLSDSMSVKRKTNDYLEKNNLDDQFDTFDLVFIRELPDEFELEMYDIVVYEREGEMIIHRIVGIEEPNSKHPDHRLFELRGDAVHYSDDLPVEYSQMKAIYEGERIPFVGSFIYFMQSPPGYLCIFLAIFGFVFAPILEKIIWKRKLRRLDKIGFFLGDYDLT